MKRALLLAAGVVALAAPAHADRLRVNGSINGEPVHGYINTGPSNFGEAFSKAFNDTQAAMPDGPGLGTYIPGVISGAKRSMSFEIQISTFGGGVRAFDPANGERFAGSYSRKDGLFVVNSDASMIGDHGSRLNCSMQIRAGSTPTGSGACTDNKKGHYTLQF